MKEKVKDEMKIFANEIIKYLKNDKNVKKEFENEKLHLR